MGNLEASLSPDFVYAKVRIVIRKFRNIDISNVILHPARPRFAVFGATKTMTSVL